MLGSRSVQTSMMLLVLAIHTIACSKTAAGDIIPGNADGRPGTLTFGGNFDFGGGTLEIRVAGVGLGHSVLAVTKTTVLSGTSNLRLVFVEGYRPGLGDRFDVLTGGDVFGAFDHINCPRLPEGLTLTVEYEANRVTVAVVSTAEETAQFVVWKESD